MFIRPIILLLLALPSFAIEPLRIGTIDVPPYGMMDNEGATDGVLYQLGSRIAQRTGLPYNNLLYPTGRVYAMLTHRQLDLAISSRSLDRDLGLVNLGKVWQMEGILLYRANLPLADPRTLADFAPFTIGRLTGTCPPLLRAGLQVKDVSDYSQGLRLLAANRLDALCGDRGGLQYALRRDTSSPPPRMFTFLTSDVWAYANPSLSQATLTQLRNATTEMVKSGEAARLIERYVPSAQPDKKP
jgi:ABC-type amino acid transport substrate-binding protein